MWRENNGGCAVAVLMNLRAGQNLESRGLNMARLVRSFGSDNDKDSQGLGVHESFTLEGGIYIWDV